MTIPHPRVSSKLLPSWRTTMPCHWLMKIPSRRWGRRSRGGQEAGAYSLRGSAQERAWSGPHGGLGAGPGRAPRQRQGRALLEHSRYTTSFLSLCLYCFPRYSGAKALESGPREPCHLPLRSGGARGYNFADPSQGAGAGGPCCGRYRADLEAAKDKAAAEHRSSPAQEGHVLEPGASPSAIEPMSIPEKKRRVYKKKQPAVGTRPLTHRARALSMVSQ
jgi:hypothetical protein